MALDDFQDHSRADAVRMCNLYAMLHILTMWALMIILDVANRQRLLIRQGQPSSIATDPFIAVLLCVSSVQSTNLWMQIARFKAEALVPAVRQYAAQRILREMHQAVQNILWLLVKRVRQESSSPGILTSVSERYRLPP